MINDSENKRAERITYRLGEYHSALDSLYECLVDREFKKAESDIKFLMSELRVTLKAIEDDDF